ncbi:carbohydrate-binding protein, partial [Kitasatospora phosalacinea]
MVPTTSTAAAACTTPYSATQVYTGGTSASYNGHNWNAKWWTQGETPSTGGSGVWADQGACGGGGGTTTTPTACNHPTWVAGTQYATGSIVKYAPNGQYYIATHDNPGYDPTISTWFWSPYTCSGGGTSPSPSGTVNPGGFVVSEAQFNQMFPNRNSFYTYSGLVAALKAY